MFSSTFLAAKSSKSIYRVIPSQQCTVRLFENRLDGSLGLSSTSPLSSSLSFISQQTGSDGENRRNSIFDFLIKSISSGALIVGIGWQFGSHVSFADFPKETTWTVKEEDQFQYPSPPNQNAEKKSKFLFGGKNVHPPPLSLS